MTIAFRIATFNLEDLDDGGDTDLDARIAVLRPQLMRLEADILCLQEVNGRPAAGHGPRAMRALDRLLAATPYAGFSRCFTKGRDGVGALDVHNLVILSRFPMLRHAQIHHQLVAPPHHRLVTMMPASEMATAVPWDRPLLHAEIEIASGRRLHVLNLHLRAPLAAFIPGQKESSFIWKSTAGWAEGFYLADIKRAGQALEARLLIDRLFDAEPDALVAVCGDFNAELQDPPVRILRADPADTGNPALASRALAPAEGAVEPGTHFSVRHGAHRVMLDHLLVSRLLAPYCRRAEVHNEALEDEAAPDAPSHPGSFHAPLVAEFALRS